MNKRSFIKRCLIKTFTIAFASLFFCTASEAMPVSVFDGSWTLITDDNGHTSGPGGGGQAFDAEYLFYKLEGNILSIGLQTGFNMETGTEYYAGDPYYAGDLVLSIDGATIGDPSTYEYAVDFGFPGVRGPEGFYQVTEWYNSKYSQHKISDPYAMKTGSKIGDLVTNYWGYDDTYEESYYRIVAFDIFTILGIMPGEEFTMDVHWTESCGNDNINGSITSTPVPEPTTLLLLSSGLFGLIACKRRKKS